MDRISFKDNLKEERHLKKKFIFDITILWKVLKRVTSLRFSVRDIVLVTQVFALPKELKMWFSLSSENPLSLDFWGSTKALSNVLVPAMFWHWALGACTYFTYVTCTDTFEWDPRVHKIGFRTKENHLNVNCWWCYGLHSWFCDWAYSRLNLPSSAKACCLCNFLGLPHLGSHRTEQQGRVWHSKDICLSQAKIKESFYCIRLVSLSSGCISAIFAGAMIMVSGIDLISAGTTFTVR